MEKFRLLCVLFLILVASFVRASTMAESGMHSLPQTLHKGESTHSLASVESQELMSSPSTLSLTEDEVDNVLRTLVRKLKGNPDKDPGCKISCRAGTCGCGNGVCSLKTIRTAAHCMLGCETSKIKNCLESAKRAFDHNRLPWKEVDITGNNYARSEYRMAFRNKLYGHRRARQYRTSVGDSLGVNEGRHVDVGTKNYCRMKCRASVCGSSFSRASKCMTRCPTPEIKNCLGAIGKKILPQLKRLIR